MACMAQDLGFSLDEIAGLLALRVKHASACAAVEAREPTSECPILEMLEA